MKMEGIKPREMKYFYAFCENRFLKEIVFYYLLRIHIFLSRDF